MTVRKFFLATLNLKEAAAKAKVPVLKFQSAGLTGLFLVDSMLKLFVQKAAKKQKAE